MSVLSQPRILARTTTRLAADRRGVTQPPLSLRDLASPNHHWRDLTVAATTIGALLLAVQPARPAALVLLAHVFVWPVLMGLVVRRVEPLGGGRLPAHDVLLVAGETFVVLAAVAWLVDATVHPGLLLAAVGASALLGLLGDRLPHTGEGTARPRVLLAGHRDAVRRMEDELIRTGAKHLEIVGTCPATLTGIAQAAPRSRADHVLLLPCAHLAPDDVRRLTWRLADQGRRLHLVTGLVGVTGVRTHLDARAGITLVNLRHTELTSLRRTLLQALGRFVALLLLVLATPVLLVIAAGIALESPGRPFFRQVRVGADGRPFVMLKFRTMHSDDRVRPTGHGDDPDHVLFKMRSDPRITGLGGLLRRYSLDELPQLVNVVRGEMALVGPRPALPDEVRRYQADVHRRLAVRPGITGLWQVSGRSDLSWEETVRLDLEYVDNWTPGLDARILARTVTAVLLHRGAY